ncbi:MAG: hypothetical protein Q8L81_08405 [Bacteroidota bacterium]|nr:hypothetical protein [Bacteroidota bacterium]
MIKNTISLVLCFVFYATIAQTKQKFTISGKALQTFAYCGGVKPSEEVLDHHKTPKPYVGKTFYIRAGKTNNLKAKVLLKFKADTAGNFSFELPPGIYSIIQEPQLKKLNVKLYKNKYVEVDETCLKNWWEKPYYLLEIKDKNISGLEFKFHHPCFMSGDIPCLHYSGPMPP